MNPAETLPPGGRLLPFGLQRAKRPYTPRIALKQETQDAIHESFARRSFALRNKNPMLSRLYGAARLFDTGRNQFNIKGIGWTTDTQKAMLLDCTTGGTWLKIVSAASNANPVVYTVTANGFANNDVCCIGGITGNLSANQLGLVAAQATNTIQLTTLLGGFAVAGSGAYGAGGYALNLTQAVFVADILGTRVSTDQTIAGKTSSKGIANATSPITWPTVPPGNPIQAIVFYDAAGGSDGANQLVGWQDGRVQVLLGKAAIAGDTTLIVGGLKAQLWDGVTGAAPVMHWSDGHSSTLNAAANQGDLTLTITAQAAGGVALGSTADAVDFGGGLPQTPSGANVSMAIGTIYYPLLPTGIYVL